MGTVGKCSERRQQRFAQKRSLGDVLRAMVRGYEVGGRLGAALACRCFDLGWVARLRDTRAVAITPVGRTGFAASFGITLDA